MRRYRESDGVLCLDVRYERGLKHGPFRDDTIPAGVFTDARAVTEEGAFDRDLATGVWRLRDAGGAVIVERDLGVAMHDDALAALAGAGAGRRRRRTGRGGAPAAELAQSLRRERRVGEAILAMARSAAVTGDAGPLRELLAQATWPRAPQAAAELATDR